MIGYAVLLIDESEEMKKPGLVLPERKTAVSAESARKTKAELAATAVNSLLNRLTQFADFEVALVGYRTSLAGNVVVGSRWAGPLADREFVSGGDLKGAPLKVEQRIRRIPAAGATGGPSVEFPIWYEPTLEGTAPQTAVFQHCRQLICRRSPSTAPVVIRLTGSTSSDGSPSQAISQIQEMDFPNGKPVVMHVHLAGFTKADVLRPIAFPANRAYLPPGAIQEMFDRASPLPAAMLAALRADKLTIHDNARAMIYDGSMLDMTRVLSLVQRHAEACQGKVLREAARQTVSAGETAPETFPAAGSAIGLAPGSVSPQTPALILFVVDRSVEDPYGSNRRNACARLVGHLGDQLGQIAKSGRGCIDTAIVSYGMGDGGEVEVRDALEGQLQGRTFVRDNELEAGAIHIDEFVEERDDGLGRIIKIPHRRPEVVDIQPTSAVPARPAFKRVAELISSWLVDHPGGSTPPIIVHLSRGSLEIADIREAVQELESCRTLGLEPLVYHLVETEFAHRTVKYPANPSELTDRRLSELWELSSPLLAREELAKDRPQLTSGSRGFVVNANLDLLLHPIREAIGED